MQNKRYLYYLLLMIISIIQTSCTRYFYAPSANNVPLFKEKKEGRIQAQYSSGSQITGFEIQGAYAVSNHAAVQLNYYYAGDEGDDGNGHNVRGFGSYVELAGGYYLPFENNKLIFETYGGLGFGSVKNFYQPNAATTSISKFLVQPSLGFSSKYFEVALSSKFSLVNTGVKKSTLTKDVNGYDYDDIETIRNSKPFMLWEPGFTMKGGFENFKFIIQYTVTKPFDKYNQVSMDDSNVSIGVMVPFKIKPHETQ